MPRITLITGATDGIGAALARRCRAAGDRLVLVGRRPLDRVADDVCTAATYCVSDLSQPFGDRPVVEFLRQAGIERLDRLILNAGAGYAGPLDGQSAASIDEAIDVNVRSVVDFCHGLLPWLRRSQKPEVVLVGSVLSALAAPEYAVYAASKAAVDGFGRSLASEWRGRVAVRVVRPGGTRTGMHRKVGIDEDDPRLRGLPSADAVAGRLLAAVDAGKAARTLGTKNRLLRGGMDWLGPLLDRLPAGRKPSPWEGEPYAPVAAVTGAGGGIGRELAVRLAARSVAVLGVDRDDAGLRATAQRAGPAFVPVLGDLADAADRSRLIDAVAARGPLDTLVHCAGISATGPFVSIPREDLHRVIDVNLRAPLHWTARLLERDGIAEHGSVVFLSSLSHFVGYPGAAVYAATKDGLAGYARSLRKAVGKRGIGVLCVYPGPVRTEHARRYSPPGSDESRRRDPATVAAEILAAIDAGRATLKPGVAAKAAATLGWLLPGVATAAMRRALYRPLAQVSADRPTGSFNDSEPQPEPQEPSMAFEQAPLPYDYSALEPNIDAQTMEIHYSKHHAGYVKKLNDALEGHDQFANMPIQDLLQKIDQLPADKQTAVRNNGGGHANHTLFWNVMGPGAGGKPSGELAGAIDKKFGSFDAFKEKFENAAKTRFGSGWAWLVVTGAGDLEVMDTPNQDSPIMEGHRPILGLDVWEHAYYLKYQNKRPDYVSAFWNVIDWSKVGQRYEEAKR